MVLVADAIVALIVGGLALSYVPRWWWVLCYMFLMIFVTFYFTRRYGEKEYLDWFERELKKLPSWLQEGLK